MSRLTATPPDLPLKHMALFGRESERDQQRAEAWARWFRTQHPYALASLVLGIFSLIEFGALIIFGIAGIIAGAVALVQLRRNRTAIASGAPDEPTGHPGNAGAIDYADRDVPPAIHARDYERPDDPKASSHGDALAWGGIITSILSLILAAWLYLRSPG